MAQPSPTLDRDEVARFARLGGDWWDANGPFKPLHRLNPVRLTYIRDRLCAKFGRDAEYQADELGFRYMTRDNYDPRAMSSMFTMLQRQSAMARWAKSRQTPTRSSNASAAVRVPRAK